MEACGRINMQASLRRNQNQRNRSLWEPWQAGDKTNGVHDRVRHGGRYDVVGQSMRALRRRNLVKVTDTGRRLDKADQDHLEYSRPSVPHTPNKSIRLYIAVMKLEVRTAHGRAEKGWCGHDPFHDISGNVTFRNFDLLFMHPLENHRL